MRSLFQRAPYLPGLHTNKLLKCLAGQRTLFTQMPGIFLFLSS